jgi:glycosyltransferase involved in cell wall biosynthesis
MKIVFPVTNLAHAGGERTIVQLASQMAEAGNEVVLLVPKNRFQSYFTLSKKVNITKIRNVGTVPVFSLIYSLFQLFRAIPKADIIVATYCFTAYAVWLAVKLRKVGNPVYFVQHYEPIFFDSRSISELKHTSKPLIFLNRIYKKLLKYLSTKTYTLPMIKIAISDWIAQQMAKDSLANGTVIVLKHYSSNQGQFYIQVDQNLKANEEIKKILCIPINKWWKGFDDFIRSINILYQRGIRNIEIWLMSKENVDYSKINFKCRVFSPESDAEVRKIYSTADVFVSSSIFEGFCLPPLEAMACGTPVVTTDSGGVRQYAKDRYNALVVPSQHPEHLADAINLILHDATLSDSLIQNGLETAGEYTVEKMTEELMPIFNTLSREHD